jgi:kynurenine formamidase
MRVRRAVDLSMPLDDDTPVYPGDPPVRLTPAATIDRDGYNLLAVHLGSQSGTHCDAPFHFRPDGARVDELDLRLFTGPGVLVDVRGLAPRTAIGVAHLGPLSRVGPGTIVVLHTGWSAHVGTRRYADHPYLGADACRALLDRGVRTIGLDTPNVDETPSAPGGTRPADDAEPSGPAEGPGLVPPSDWPCHRMIAAAGGVIVENLVNLAAVDFPDPFLSVLPLRLTGADGAPVRAVAMQLDGG